MLLIDEVQNVLGGIRNVDKVPGNAFALVLFLLELQDKSVELLLQRLVAIVDAEVFEGIVREGLKPEDIQNADERRVGG